jgi:hypothetical protein
MPSPERASCLASEASGRGRIAQEAAFLQAQRHSSLWSGLSCQAYHLLPGDCVKWRLGETLSQVNIVGVALVQTGTSQRHELHKVFKRDAGRSLNISLPGTRSNLVVPKSHPPLDLYIFPNDFP